MPRKSAEAKALALLCRHSGCTRKWTSSFGPYPACDLHKPTASAPTPSPKVPTTPPAKSWADPERDDE